MNLTMYNKVLHPTQAHKQLGFKLLGVRRSRLQAFCTVDREASTKSPTAYSLVRCVQVSGDSALCRRFGERETEICRAINTAGIFS